MGSTVKGNAAWTRLRIIFTHFTESTDLVENGSRRARREKRACMRDELTRALRVRGVAAGTMLPDALRVRRGAAGTFRKSDEGHHEELQFV